MLRMNLQDLQESMKEVKEVVMDMVIKCQRGVSRHESWRNDELRDTTAEELTEDNLMRMSASEPVPGGEKNT